MNLNTRLFVNGIKNATVIMNLSAISVLAAIFSFFCDAALCVRFGMVLSIFPLFISFVCNAAPIGLLFIFSFLARRRRTPVIYAVGVYAVFTAVWVVILVGSILGIFSTDYSLLACIVAIVTGAQATFGALKGGGLSELMVFLPVFLLINAIFSAVFLVRGIGDSFAFGVVNSLLICFSDLFLIVSIAAFGVALLLFPLKNRIPAILGGESPTLVAAKIAAMPADEAICALEKAWEDGFFTEAEYAAQKMAIDDRR